MTLPSLISFSGYPRAGKDAASDLLVSRAKFIKTSMTTPIEQSLLRMNPWIVDYRENTIERFADLHEKLGYDGAREFEEVQRLIQVGTEVGRDVVGRNVWTDAVFKDVLKFRSLDRNVVVSNVEYADELALVRENGGVSVWIERRGTRPSTMPRGITTITAEDCDIVVVNSGNLKDLYINSVIALEEFNSNNEGA